MDKSMKIQSQIRQNAEEMSSFYNDLSKWEATAAKRDKAIKDSKKKKPPRQFASNSPLVVSGESYSKSVEAMQSGPSTNPVENGQSEILTPASLVAQHSIPIVAPSTVPKASGELSTESMETKVRELGNAEYLKGNFEQAIKLYTKCIGLKLNNYVGFSNRAMAFIKIKDFLQAEKDCNSALSIEKTHIKSLTRRATCRNALGKHRGAMQDLYEALAIANDGPESKSIKADILKTKELLRNAVSHAPMIGISTVIQLGTDNDTEGENTVLIESGPEPMPPHMNMR